MWFISTTYYWGTVIIAAYISQSAQDFIIRAYQLLPKTIDAQMNAININNKGWGMIIFLLVKPNYLNRTKLLLIL